MSDHQAQPNAARQALPRGARATPLARSALIEYVLILCLSRLRWLPCSPSPARQWATFSNTVYNLLGGTVEPRHAGRRRFLTQVAAASYTPESPGLVTNTPALPTGYPHRWPPTATDITPSSRPPHCHRRPQPDGH